MEDDVEARRKPGRRTIVFGSLGCLGCLGAVLLVIGIGSVLDLDAIQELLRVSSALREEFGIRTEVSRVEEFGGGPASLQIEVRGHDLQDEPRAREIAVFAAKLLSTPEDFARVEVLFVKRVGGVIRFEAGKEYRFAMSELLPPEPAGSDD